MHAIVYNAPESLGQRGHQQTDSVNPTMNLIRWNDRMSLNDDIYQIVGHALWSHGQTQQLHTSNVQSVCGRIRELIEAPVSEVEIFVTADG